LIIDSLDASGPLEIHAIRHLVEVAPEPKTFFGGVAGDFWLVHRSLRGNKPPGTLGGIAFVHFSFIPQGLGA
jgi:hypothetical protein